MNRRRKTAIRVKTKDGYEIRAWRNSKGEITPTNWKIQAGYLSGPIKS